mmetsp:Transcript_15416/g.49621  ORF Transcript_15416/g.49621 Transcript_15416/m.49621 type:complete len:206 (+) Transcript_15416:3331-3948(+)
MAVKKKPITPPSSRLLRTCFSSAVRRSPSCSSSDGSHANSLSSRTPCRSSEVNFTRRSRSAIVRRVKAPILRESCVLSGIEKTMMKMPARPATPRKLQSITVAMMSVTGPDQSRCRYGSASPIFEASICMYETMAPVPKRDLSSWARVSAFANTSCPMADFARRPSRKPRKKYWPSASDFAEFATNMPSAQTTAAVGESGCSPER